jgi:CRP-like cAMP-binding protein
VPYSKNNILARLSPRDRKQLEPHLQSVELEHGRIVADSRQRMNKVYFPHGGILSCVVELASGLGIETGMIGNDGVVGAAQALDHKISLNKIVVQVACPASVVDADVVRRVGDASSDFRGLLVQCEQFFLAQVQQTTACNAVHGVEQRMCKWLLRMYELAGSDLPLTQEFLAQMMGVRRTSVTEIALQMQKEGLIWYRRGKVHIENIAHIQKRACECHQTIREHYEALFGDKGQLGTGTNSGLGGN